MLREVDFSPAPLGRVMGPVSQKVGRGDKEGLRRCLSVLAETVLYPILSPVLSRGFVPRCSTLPGREESLTRHRDLQRGPVLCVIQELQTDMHPIEPGWWPLVKRGH